ncbi:exopolysaccharide biosynthesis protein [Lichenihabitans sp. Uapishka_5]|uniref:exopolysaccharide biosynthesis protein n=1 Tax=Lichenihabitans sp. Uapishka_5 TaxID=3037302 RepID=UPI0029E7DE29|nr:exopolysaccharide biosynthesis protein [Lichenihabitans sp. Uapishka_5]MDX7950420.1 exopolysaccharide biosynthesis protein [Lichenihabitans sp. Uapishka_5]
MSQVLTALAAEPGERIPVRTIFGALSDRSFALLVVLLGLPNCLPMPPPIPALSAVALIVVAVQMAILRPAPWLPHRLLRGSVPRAELLRAVGRALPYVARLERWSQPRLNLFEARTGAILSGLLLMLLAIGMLFAAPFVGQVPYGIAVCLVGLGQVERDGLLVSFGVVAGAIGAALSASFLYALFRTVDSMI